MSRVKDVSIELSVLVGKATMPVHQLLRMGRGAVIALDTQESDPMLLLANNAPVAEGQILVEGDKISLAITRILPAAGGTASAGRSEPTPPSRRASP